MKTRLKPRPAPGAFRIARHRRRGVALISVLAVMILITALVVGFLFRAGRERSATASYVANSSAQLLADTAVNLVQAQINEATSSGLAWASQPGAIRVFDNSGNLQNIYRLYSAPTLSAAVTQANVGTVLANDLAPGNWAGNPGLWTDLNAPMVISGTTATDGTPVPAYSVYPVLDPRNPADPGTLAAPKVTTAMPGFSIDAATAPGATAAQPAPMPVRWLYVLQNGEVLAPTQSGSTITVAGASAANPITGRIAFWTDDETAKVNIDTAAGSFSERNGTVLPAPWDTPRFKIFDELKIFSENQPMMGEYQRYPGHPATTDLHKILSGLGISLSNYPVQQSAAGASSSFFELLPRYNDDNGSKGGTFNTTTLSTPVAVTSSSDRLFSSLGEAFYSPARISQGISRQQLESGKFFLTAHSRAPETTLFGTPRVAIWPVHKDTGTTKRTAYDNLIAFCSTVNGMPYYIQRNDSRSQTSDYDNIKRNRELYSYLRDETSREIPGFGGSFESKYSVANERDQILTEIMDYIRCTNLHDNSKKSTETFTRFTDNPGGITGYSFQAQATPLKIVANGATTRGLGRIQTFSEIGIHIICTADGNSPLGAYVVPATVAGQKVSPVKGSANDPFYASNLPENQYLRDTSGTLGKIIGWDDTAKQVTTGTETDLPATGGPFPANQTLTTTGLYGGPLQALAPGERKLQAMLLFEIACPTMGYDVFQLNDSSNRPAYKINVSGIQGITIGGLNPFPSRTTTTDIKAPNLNGNGFIDKMSTRSTVQGTGGLMGFRYLLGDRSDRLNAWSGNNPYTAGTMPYRYVSNPFTVSSTTLSLGGGFKAELHVPTSSGSDPVQTVNVEFPAVSNVPVPDLPKNGFSGNDGSGNPFAVNVPADWWGFDQRIARAVSARTNGNGSAPIHGPGAVIRADVPVSGTWDWGKRANVQMPTFANQSSATFSGSDVVRTLVARDGDYRLVAAKEVITANGANSSPYDKGPGYDAGVKLGHLLKDQNTALGVAGVDNGGKLVAGAPYSWQIVPKVPSNIDSKKQSWDWDSGLPAEPDGAYANKPDEGNIYTNNQSPYYNREQQGDMNKIVSYFTANRIVSSPVMFGSLPSGVMENISWRTLLFRPQANRPQDPSGPKDHLILDLFWMPVVEPYAISEPFSTAGKVNMNYQIVPFTYINRSTALQAVLSSELVVRVPKAAAAALASWDFNNYYKGKLSSGTSTPPNSVSVGRFPLNMSETDGALRQFKARFAAGEIFKSASEICDIYLTPQGYNWTTNSQADTAWYGDDFALVGDNVRERPYGNIYPRLTTKSNTFKVYYKVQVLKNTNSTPSTWDESKGVVTGEFVGSTTIERYLDPNNKEIPDYATDPAASSLDNYYQWRTVATDGFPP